MPESKRAEPADQHQAVPVPKDPHELRWDPELLCNEAQADGVPCTEVGRACAECERAIAAKRRRS